MTSYTQGWYFEKKDLMKPLREGGSSWETAVKYRQEMYLFITELGRRLSLYDANYVVLYQYNGHSDGFSCWLASLKRFEFKRT